MIEIKNEEIFEEVDEIKSVKVFESDNNQTFFKGSGENLKNYRIYGENGKNLLNDKKLEVGGLNAINGEEIVDTTTIRTSFIKGFSNYYYYLTLFNDEYKIENVYYYNYNYLFLGKIEVNSNYTNLAPITLTLFIRITFKKKDETQNISTLDLENKVMLNKSKPSLFYEPYGESVGDLVTSGEHTGEYKVPVTVEGKNLLQNTATSQTVNGVTFTVNADGSVTCNGTASATTFLIYSSNITISEKAVLTGCPNGGGAFNYLLKIQKYSTTDTIVNDTGVGSSEFYYADPIDVVIRIASGYTCDNLTFYPMIRKADITDDTYEPYHVPVTTPIYLDAPLCKVKGAEEYIDFLTQKVHRIQKNLLPNNAQLPTTINGVKWSIRKSDGAIMAERVSPSESPSDLVYTSSFIAPANQIFVLKLFYEGEEPSATTYSANVIYNNIDHWNGNGIYRFETDTEMSVVLRFSPEYNGIAIFAPIISNYNYNDFFDYTPYIQNTEQSITLPAISTFSDTNILSVNTKVEPSKIWGRISEPRNIEYIKDNLGNILFSKYHTIEGEPPLSYTAKKAGFLTDYRIYGQTSRNLSEVNEFSNSITDTSDKLRIWVQQGKNDSFVYPDRSNIFVITEPTTITTHIAITNDNDSIRIKHNGTKNDIYIDVVRGLSPGVYSVSFNVLDYDQTTVGGIVINNIMVNKGSAALPYEPYGESVGDLVTSGEHAGEYKVSVTVSNGTDTLTTPIYLPEQIKKVGDEAEYIDYAEQKQHRVRKNLAPTISSENGWVMGYIDANTGIITTTHAFGEVLSPLLSLTNITSFTISAFQCNLPSLSVYYYQNGTYVGARSSTNYSGATFDKAPPFTGVTDFRFAIRTGAENDTIQDVIDSGFWVMLNTGNTALPYEPYIENTDLDVTLPALPTLTGTNVLSVGTEVQPSEVYIKGKIKEIN